MNKYNFKLSRRERCKISCKVLVLVLFVLLFGTFLGGIMFELDFLNFKFGFSDTFKGYLGNYTNGNENNITIA